MGFSDVVSISATTAGVSGTVTVPNGARLKGLNISFTQAATAELPYLVELSWAGSSSQLKFVPPAISMVAGTPVGGQAFMKGGKPWIPLDVIVQNATTVTIKITSTGNLTCKCSLEWD